MDYTYGITIGLHTLAVAIWVGGMFFALVALGPAAAALPPAERLALWRRVLPRFFRWVWVSIIVLLVTGYFALLVGYRGGLTGGGLHVDIMQIIGLVMVSLFFALYFGPWHGFKHAMAASDTVRAGQCLARIRQIVTINLVLGLVNSFIGAAGTFIGH